MNEIIDKLLLFICCTSLYLLVSDNGFTIVPVIIVILLGSLFVYYENGRIRLAGILCFALLCIFMPNYIIFLPILLYDILHTKYQYGALSLPVLFLIHNLQYPLLIFTFTFVFMAVAYLLKYKTDRLKVRQAEYNDLRDSSSELSQLLEEKNRSILKNQDYEINLATLNERNRISKEIHDNIGHLLSRALLQIGALLTLTKEETTKESLASLKVSLSDGLDQIRNSIHKMYDESIDLYSQIDSLVKDFTFCHIIFEYDIKSSPLLPLKHCLIAIIKEALANIMRHSNATKVSILLREHPVMYQLIIQDNGTIEESKRKILSKTFEKLDFGDSMGLRNITDRVKGFNGNIHISLEHGFQIFITIPKKISEVSK